MPEFYAEEQIRKSRALYERIRAWGSARSGVTLIGGWAVYELVRPGLAQQSRDVDLVLHNEETLLDFDQRLPEWGLQWRRRGRTTFMDCHFIEDPNREIVVDIFTTGPFGQHFFSTLAGSNLKDAAGQGFVPTLPYLLLDKVRTVPLRHDRDASRKQLKDLLDVGNLAFRNREGIEPAALAQVVPHAARLKAAGIAKQLRKEFPPFRSQLDEAIDWLSIP